MGELHAQNDLKSKVKRKMIPPAQHPQFAVGVKNRPKHCSTPSTDISTFATMRGNLKGKRKANLGPPNSS